MKSDYLNLKPSFFSDFSLECHFKRLSGVAQPRPLERMLDGF
jgi:hypothetical protein